MFKKDFFTWSERKIKIENVDKSLFFKEGEIWWTSLGINIGRETCGRGERFKRPVLIVKKFSRDLCCIIPLSSKIKTGTWFYLFEFHGIRRIALLHQIKTLSAKRLETRMGSLSQEKFLKIKQALADLFDFRHQEEHS